MRKKSKKAAGTIEVLCCPHCTAPADLKALEHTGNCKVHSRTIPCSSRVETNTLLRLLAEGAQAVQVLACNEDRCRYVVGSRLAEKRIQFARLILEKTGQNAERLGFTRIQSPKAGDVPKIIEERCAKTSASA